MPNTLETPDDEDNSDFLDELDQVYIFGPDYDLRALIDRVNSNSMRYFAKFTEVLAKQFRKAYDYFVLTYDPSLNNFNNTNTSNSNNTSSQ